MVWVKIPPVGEEKHSIQKRDLTGRVVDLLNMLADEPVTQKW